MIDPFSNTPLRKRVNLAVRVLILSLCLAVAIFALR